MDEAAARELKRKLLQASPDLRARDDPSEPPLVDAKALALSGGGFKAAVFHLGGLIRLNELGQLQQLARISSVSGGAITAAYLGLKWDRLRWNGGRADNFEEEVVRPLLHFCTRGGINLAKVWLNVLSPFSRASDALIELFETLYGDATLQSLPPARGPAPGIMISAANLQINSLWRFSREYAADYRVGMIDAPSFPLARVVAASCGFPPYYAPVHFDLAGIRWAEGADRHCPPYSVRAETADGGVYDNLGLEPIWKTYRTLLVSNAGGAFREDGDPRNDWFNQVQRTIAMIHRQAENNRVRWLIERAESGKQAVAYWTARSNVSAYKLPGALSLSDEEARLAAAVRAKVENLDRAAAVRLVHHGYCMANAAYQCWFNNDKPPEPPARFPDVF